jgi:hypothetical protein
MYFFIFWYNVLSVSIYQRLLTTYWLNLHKEYWFPMLLFCDISRVEHNQMIWDFSVLKSICVSFINIIIFENHLLIFCILNFCFVLSFVFVSCFIFVFIFLFLSLFFLLFFYLFFFFFLIYIYIDFFHYLISSVVSLNMFLFCQRLYCHYMICWLQTCHWRKP